MKRRNFIRQIAAGAVFSPFILSGCNNSECSQKNTTEHKDTQLSAGQTNSSDLENPNKGTAMTNVQKPSDKKILVVYFSHSGNTRAIAEMIHRNTDSDIFEIVTVDPYPGNYNQCVDQAKKEQNANFRPKLSTHVANMANYDTIFLGNPNWWGTLPMAVFTFLEENDLSGKTIVPFCTHEGSGLGQCPNDIAKLCPKAKLLEGLAIRGTNAKSSEKDVVRWLKGLDL